jgi:PAS domain S-box-containing protein
VQKSNDQLTYSQLESMLTTEREARARLQLEFDLRNSALNAAKTQFMIFEEDGQHRTIKYVNRAFASAHGYEVCDLLGQSPSNLMSIENNSVAFEHFTTALHAGTPASTEVVANRKDGSTFWFGMHMAPIRNSAGAVTHYVVIGADITARLAQERAQRELQEQLYSEMQERERMLVELRLAQKLESVGRLAAGIAHEINTPIQYVGDSVAFLQSSQLDMEQLLERYRAAVQTLSGNESSTTACAQVQEIEKDFDRDFLMREIPKAFERTLEGVERVAAIVRAMKEFAHPDAVEQAQADLNRAIETTLTVAQNEYRYSARIETRFGELPLVTCNVGELNQVFLNLIVNASHAITEAGKDVTEGRIAIETAASGDEISISFADNGCGIPDSHIEKIFDPFFTTKPVGRGTGQGLAITRSIVVEKHGGTIDVQSVVGGGTRFILRLPVHGRSSASAS